MTYNIGIISYDARALPAYYKLDDYLLKEALIQQGAEATIFSWTNPQIDATTFDALILRSCWDSHRNPQAFLNWLAQMEADRPRLINPYPAQLWNYQKEQYMHDMLNALDNDSSSKGKMVPSVFYSIHDSVLESSRVFQSAKARALADILAELDAQNDSVWRGQDIIIKPTISAEGDNTLCIVRNLNSSLGKSKDVLSVADMGTQLQTMLQNETCPGVIIQPLIAGIQNGEYSLIYIEGTFSHAVHKFVPADDFKNRQEDDRAGIHADALPSGILNFANQVMALMQAHFPEQTLLYARIDIVQGLDGVPILLECELVEPNLQFVKIPEAYYQVRNKPKLAEIKEGEMALNTAVSRFAKAIIKQTARLSNGKSR